MGCAAARGVGAEEAPAADGVPEAHVLRVRAGDRCRGDRGRVPAGAAGAGARRAGDGIARGGLAASRPGPGSAHGAGARRAVPPFGWRARGGVAGIAAPGPSRADGRRHELARLPAHAVLARCGADRARRPARDAHGAALVGASARRCAQAALRDRRRRGHRAAAPARGPGAAVRGRRTCPRSTARCASRSCATTPRRRWATRSRRRSGRSSGRIGGRGRGGRRGEVGRGGPVGPGDRAGRGGRVAAGGSIGGGRRGGGGSAGSSRHCEAAQRPRQSRCIGAELGPRARGSAPMHRDCRVARCARSSQ